MTNTLKFNFVGRILHITSQMIGEEYNGNDKKNMIELMEKTRKSLNILMKKLTDTFKNLFAFSLEISLVKVDLLV